MHSPHLKNQTTTIMSQSTDKKRRKEIRRVVNRNFGEGIKSLANIVRPRPRWIPKRLWVLVYIPLFPKKYRRYILEAID